MFRITLILLFTIAGVLCVTASAVIYFPSGIKPRMNKVFFQPKADAEVDALIQTATITPLQEPAIRALIRRAYMMTGVGIVFAYGAAAGALGLFFLLLAYCVWLSHRIVKISRTPEQLGSHRSAESTAE